MYTLGMLEQKTSSTEAKVIIIQFIGTFNIDKTILKKSVFSGTLKHLISEKNTSKSVRS